VNASFEAGTSVSTMSNQLKLVVMDEVKGYFRPAFIDRIDEFVVFLALDEKHIESIARIHRKMGALQPPIRWRISRVLQIFDEIPVRCPKRPAPIR